jgi:hypothetical protein
MPTGSCNTLPTEIISPGADGTGNGGLVVPDKLLPYGLGGSAYNSFSSDGVVIIDY